MNQSPNSANWTHEQHMQFGVEQGWWETWDSTGPFPPKIVVKLSELKPENRNMPSIMFTAKRFDTKGEAKRNGWRGPAVIGEHKVGRQTIKIVP